MSSTAPSAQLVQHIDLGAFVSEALAAGQTVTPKVTVATATVKPTTPTKVDRRGFTKNKAAPAPAPKAKPSPTTGADAINVGLLRFSEVVMEQPEVTLHGIDTAAPAPTAKKAAPAKPAPTDHGRIFVGAVFGNLGEVAAVIPLIRRGETYHLPNEVKWTGSNQELKFNRPLDAMSYTVLILRRVPTRGTDIAVVEGFMAHAPVMNGYTLELASRTGHGHVAPVTGDVRKDGHVETNLAIIASVVRLPHKVQEDITSMFGTDVLNNHIGEWTEAYKAAKVGSPEWAYGEVVGRPYLLNKALASAPGVKAMLQNAYAAGLELGCGGLTDHRAIARAIGAEPERLPSRIPQQQRQPAQGYRPPADMRKERTALHQRQAGPSPSGNRRQMVHA